MKKNYLRLMSAFFALVLILSTFVGSINVSANSGMWVTEGISDPTDYDYSFAIVGDTQKLVAHYANKLVLDRNDPEEIKYKYNYDVHEYPANDTFVKVYDYIINNAQDKKIAHVFGLGDITERASVWEWVQKGCPYAPDEEFSIAVEQFKRMQAAGLDFSLVRGNHESWDTYNKYLGTGEASADLGYSEMVDDVYVHPNGTVDYTNTIHYFSAGNLDYMVITLDYGASDAVLKWAGEKIEANPYKNVIITTHAYMHKDGTTIATNDSVAPSRDSDNVVYDKTNINNGDDMWNKLISRYPNIVLAMSGHEPTDDVVVSQWQGVNGNMVTNVLIDPQGMDKYYYNDGCSGAVAMFYFSNEGRKVDVRYWSTANEAYIKSNNQFSFDINVIEADYTVVNKGILELPEVANITLDDYAKVRELWEIYSAMSDGNKAKLVNAQKLIGAHEKIEEITPSESYTITWNVGGTTSTSSVSYGEIPTFSGSTFKAGKEFIGWSTEENGAVAAIGYATADATYYAVYSDVSVWDGFIPQISDTDTADTLFEGEGTKENPYLIQSATDLAELSALTKGKNFGNSSMYFKQTIDIDLTAGNWQPICTDIEYPDNKWTQWYKFSANYDGDNHTVTLKESSMKLAFGLFGALNGSVSNLVIDGTINSLGYTGALVSQAHNGATVTNVINKANINGNGNQIGGIIGNVANEANVTIIDCKNEGNINASGSFVGGIVGGGWSSVKISGSTNEGNIQGVSTIGGIISELWMNGEVVDCSNSGKITAGTTVANTNVGAGSLLVGNLIGKSNIKLTITWIVDGVSTSAQVEYGTEPTFGSVPAKDADEEYTYTFAGWATAVDGEPMSEDNLPAVTTNVTYYGIFAEEKVTPPDNPTIPDDPTTPDDPTVPDDPTIPDEPTTPEAPEENETEEKEELGFFAKLWRAILNFFRKLFGIKE